MDVILKKRLILQTTYFFKSMEWYKIAMNSRKFNCFSLSLTCHTKKLLKKSPYNNIPRRCLISFTDEKLFRSEPFYIVLNFYILEITDSHHKKTFPRTAWHNKKEISSISHNFNFSQFYCLNSNSKWN